MSRKLNLPANTAVMLCGHGSRNQLAVGEFAHLKDRLKQHAGDVPVEYGYLEFADPVIHHGLNQLKEQGIKKSAGCAGHVVCCGSCQERHSIGAQ